MDIPLSGALFITNPRRRNKRRSPAVRPNTRYKNTIIMRHTGMSRAQVQRLKSKKGKTDERYKRDTAKYNRLFKAAGGEKARLAHKKSRPLRLKKFKRVLSAAAKRKNPTMKNNPRTIWHKYLKVMKGKGYSMFELKAGFNTLKRKYPASKGYRGLLGAARKLKPKAHAAKSKSQRSAAAKSRATSKLKAKRGKDGKMRYFGYRNGKYGLIKKSVYMSRKKLRKPRKKPASRRKAVSRKTARRRSAKRVTVPFTGGQETTTWSALVKRHGVKKASKIYRSYGGLSANPKRRRKAVRRRNPKSSFGALALRKNPGLLGILDKGGSAVSNVPVVGGFLGPKVAPLGLGLVVGGVHFYAMRYLGPKLPDLGAMVGGYLGREEQGYDLGVKAQKVGYTIGGVAVATALQAGRKFAPKMFPAATVNVLSTGALLVGAAVDFIDYMRGGDSSEASMDEEFSGLAYTGGQLNGLAYEGGQLNGMHMNGAHMNGAHLNGMHALNEAYMRAPFEDADYSGADFNGHEGQAFMGGPAAYMAKFGLPAMRAGRRSGMSSMAGKQGHRWGWLVRLLGFDRTAQLASMPARQRVRIIAKMRREAKRLVDRTSPYSGLAYEGGALNGLAYEGGQLNGLAYTGGQLNGLAYTGGRV